MRPCTSKASTIARKTGFAFEWETAEIDMASKGITMPADFSVIHYAILCYPAEVLGKSVVGRAAPKAPV